MLAVRIAAVAPSVRLLLPVHPRASPEIPQALRLVSLESPALPASLVHPEIPVSPEILRRLPALV